MMTPKMMIWMTTTKICHPFPGPCLLPETNKKPKDKKVIGKGFKNFLIEDPERTRNSIKQHKSFDDKKKKEKENSTSKSKLKPNKKPLLIKFSTKPVVN